MLDWKASHKTVLTAQDYEAQMRHLDLLRKQNQDDIVNGLSGSLEIGSPQWKALFQKGSDLERQKTAYNMGLMGQLDGERAAQATVGEV